MESPNVRGLLTAMREQAPALFARIIRNVQEMQVAVAPPPAPPPEVPQVPQLQVQDTATAPPKPIPTNIEPQRKLYVPIWIAIGIDILGVAALGLGYYFDMQAGDYHENYKNMSPNQSPGEYASAYRDVKDAKKMRNISYGAGGVFLLGGAVLHIWF